MALPPKRINDITPAVSISNTMQIEIDIGGVIENKINVSQLETYFNTNLLFSPTTHIHTTLNGGETF